MEPAGDSTFPNWPEFRRLFAYDDLVGKVVQNRYEVVRRLGAGGMGVVFLARHIHLDKLFALKIISPRFLDDPQIGQRFLLEARAASKIDHPNVVNITDFGPPEEGPAFFAMEYLEGEDLARLLALEGPLPWQRALPIASQIARALAAAHARGVIHRDIKPQNCLRVTRDDNPDFIKVLDFGLAKVLTATGKSAWTVGGSPGYIAPEIYRGGRTDHRVDIFALGALLHTLLLGRLPAQTPADVDLPAHAPVLHLADLPAPLRDLLARCLADDPDHRPADADALLAALDDTRGRLGAPAPTILAPVPADSSTYSRRWPLAAALALAAVSFVGTANAQDVAAGEKSFNKCRACHQVGETAKNSVGPELNGLFGRKSGSVAGYNYSDANKNSGITWDDAVFAEYIKDPKAKIPGTKMAFAGLKKPDDVANVIAFLKAHP